MTQAVFWHDAVSRVARRLDELHATGLVIPEPVAKAAETLAAFSVALAHNAQGKPCPADVRPMLGLPPIPTPDPMQTTIEEVMNP